MLSRPVSSRLVAATDQTATDQTVTDQELRSRATLLTRGPGSVTVNGHPTQSGQVRNYIVATEPNLESPNLESMFKSAPPVVFGPLSAIAVAIWWNPLASLFALALHNDQYTHILLILPISAALILLRWKTPAGPSVSSAAVGSALLLLAVMARVSMVWIELSSADVKLSLNILALVAWWIGTFLSCFGARAFRRALFPLCFLLWMVPLPQFILDPLVKLLQQGSADSAHMFFAVAGFPVEQRGTLIHIPGLTLEVAPECSSIRSSMMLLVTSMVCAQLLLHSFWRKAVVFAVAIPLCVVKNGLRIFVLGVLATKVDPGFLTGRFHRQGGIVFLLIALLAIFLLIWLLRRGEKQESRIDTSGSVQKISVEGDSTEGRLTEKGSREEGSAKEASTERSPLG
jgi:exosortase